MVSLAGFDASSIEQNDDFAPLPLGEYPVMLVDSKPTSTNKGIILAFDVVCGEYQGRKLWANANIFHENPAAKEFGDKLLSSLMYAANKPTAQQTEELIGVTVIARVKLQKNDPTKNDISGFKSATLTAAPAAIPVTLAQPVATPTAIPVAPTAIPVAPSADGPPPWGAA